MRAFTVILLLVWSLIGVCIGMGSCKADDYLSVTVASYHTDRSTKHNEENWGLGIEHGLTEKTRVVGGFYKNSYWRQSVYAGITYYPWQLGPVKIGAMFGGVTGYDSGVSPTILPTLAIEGKVWGVNLGIMPSLDERAVTAIGLQIKFNLK